MDSVDTAVSCRLRKPKMKIEPEFTGKICKAVNNANVLTIDGMIVSPHIATLAGDAWLKTKHAEDMENVQDFLKSAIKEIAKIEDAYFK